MSDQDPIDSSINSINPIKKVLILYLQAGGGHKSNATSLHNTLKEYNPNLEIELFDFGVNGPIKESSYIWLTEKAKPIWYLVSILVRNKFIIKFCNFWFQVFYKQIIEKKFSEFEPDLVLNTYYFSASTIDNLLSNLPQNRNITAITDTWSAPSVWFSNTKLQYLVFSESAFERGLACSVPKRNLIRSNYFFDSKFNQELDSDQINQFLISRNLRINLDNIVILGGGGSMPNGEKILFELIKTLEQASNNSNHQHFQIICICGRNQTLYNLCLEAKQKFPLEIQKLVLIEGFTQNVYEYLNSAKVVISKAGPASILETLALKKPLIISSYIWEQELANKDFIVNNQVGYYQTNPKKIAITAINLLTDKDKYLTLKQNIIKLNLHSNNQEIAKSCLYAQYNFNYYTNLSR